MKKLILALLLTCGWLAGAQTVEIFAIPNCATCLGADMTTSVSVTNGSSTVTWAGTNPLVDPQFSSAWVGTQPKIHSIVYTVTGYTDPTHVTISPAYNTDGGTTTQTLRQVGLIYNDIISVLTNSPIDSAVLGVDWNTIENSGTLSATNGSATVAFVSGNACASTWPGKTLSIQQGAAATSAATYTLGGTCGSPTISPNFSGTTGTVNFNALYDFNSANAGMDSYVAAYGATGKKVSLLLRGVSSGGNNTSAPGYVFTGYGANISAMMASPPASPTLTGGAGGNLATGTCFVKISFVNPQGESAGSTEASTAVTGPTGSCSVPQPTLPTNATGYTAYSSPTTGTEKQQTASPNCVNITGTCLITTYGAGASPLTSATSGGPVVSVTNGSPTVTWVSGQKFIAGIIGQTVTIDNNSVTVLVFNSPTSLSLSANYGGTTNGTAGLSYAPTQQDICFCAGYSGATDPATGIAAPSNTCNHNYNGTNTGNSTGMPAVYQLPWEGNWTRFVRATIAHFNSVGLSTIFKLREGYGVGGEGYPWCSAAMGGGSMGGAPFNRYNWIAGFNDLMVDVAAQNPRMPVILAPNHFTTNPGFDVTPADLTDSNIIANGLNGIGMEGFGEFDQQQYGGIPVTADWTYWYDLMKGKTTTPIGGGATKPFILEVQQAGNTNWDPRNNTSACTNNGTCVIAVTSLSRSGGVSTLQVARNVCNDTSLIVGSSISILNADSSFNGTFLTQSMTCGGTTTITFNQTGLANATAASLGQVGYGTFGTYDQMMPFCMQHGCNDLELYIFDALCAFSTNLVNTECTGPPMNLSTSAVAIATKNAIAAFHAGYFPASNVVH